MENNQRGERIFKVDGQECVLSPSFEAMALIERLTGKGIIELAWAAAAKKLVSFDMAVIVFACHKSALQVITERQMPWTLQNLAKLIYQNPGGYLKLQPICIELLTVMAMGGKDEDEETEGTEPGELKAVP